MPPQIFWIHTNGPGRLAIMPRPRGGDWLDDELNHLRREGVNIVVSLLTPEEVEELNLLSQPDKCAAAGIEYINFPIEDRRVPADELTFADLLRQLKAKLVQGKAIAVHCRAGIGRSAVVAACLLCGSDIGPEEALKLIAETRRCSVPDTEPQRDWIIDFVRRNPSNK